MKKLNVDRRKLMQVNEMERNSEGKVVYKITLPSKKVDEAIERVYKDLVKIVNIPGFRKGKVPKKVLEVRVGKEYFQEEAKKILVEESYYEAFKKIEDKALSQEIDNLDLTVGKDFTYEIKLETIPEVDIKSESYKGLEIKFTPEAFSDDKVEKAIEDLRKRHAEQDEKKDGAIEKGDVAIIDFLGKVDGTPFEGGEGKDYSLEIGSKTFIDNFEDQLIGLKVGDKKDVKATFPEDYREEKLAGKEATFEVEIKMIKEMKLPEINEEFLKKVNYKTEEEMKKDLEKKTKEMVENNNKVGLENKLVDAAVENSKIEAPEKMVEYLIDKQIEEIEQNMKKYFPHMTINDYLKAINTTMENLRDQQRDKAKKQAQAEFVLKNIARIEKIEATEEDVKGHIEKMAEGMNQKPDKLMEVIEMQGNMKFVKEEVQLQKTVDFLK
ncbi:MAG: trigger factor [Candidatus Muiribacterium halophilum]|uniref:Trigger factor n=1 Tax=Muiribacterium halophilum TaxID=2053465 RepID=A0A2N5ZMY7_MUIH1|nr:MAG: trigger factor [Candidatus Muirbacterium halophilum]